MLGILLNFILKSLSDILWIYFLHFHIYINSFSCLLYVFYDTQFWKASIFHLFRPRYKIMGRLFITTFNFCLQYPFTFELDCPWLCIWETSIFFFSCHFVSFESINMILELFDVTCSIHRYMSDMNPLFVFRVIIH